VNIIEAIEDPNLFRPVLGDLSTWDSWLTVLKALFGLPLTADELKVFTQLTGRETAPTQRAAEAFFVVGRRSGKSKIVSVVSAYIAAFIDHSKYLSPGEKGILMVISQNRRQARIIFSYLQSIFTDIPMLSKLILNMGKESIALINNIIIEIHVCNFRSVRGHTVVAGVLDEIAFWMQEDSASPDHEVVNSLRPAMATIPGAMLIGLSSPYRRNGVLFEQHREHYGKDGSDVLVIQSDSQTMNSTLDQKVIDTAYQRDPESARAEYGGHFRNDLSAFFDPTLLQSVIPSGLMRRHYIENIQYRGFVDPSGGSADAFTLAIGHQEKDMLVLDVVEERKPPFSPEAVTKDFAALLKHYHVRTVTGDRYGGEFPRELFRKHGINHAYPDDAHTEVPR